MEVRQALRAVHTFLCRGVQDGVVTVHLDRDGEEYIGLPVGLWPRARGVLKQANARPLSWDARDFVLGLRIEEQGKQVVLYLDLDDVVAITGPPVDSAP